MASCPCQKLTGISIGGIENGMGLRELNPWKQGVGQAAGQRGFPLGSSYTGDHSTAESASRQTFHQRKSPGEVDCISRGNSRTAGQIYFFCFSINAKKVTKHYQQQTFKSEHTIHPKYKLFLSKSLLQGMEYMFVSQPQDDTRKSLLDYVVQRERWCTICWWKFCSYDFLFLYV